MSLQPGITFAGRYEIARRIAEGGMGAVYEVIHVETGRRRALKVLHPHVLRDKKAREQFRREARIGGVIESESIVDVFDAGIDEPTQTPFLVMELLRGEDLGRRVERLGPAPGAEVVEHLRQASFAIDKAHAAGVVHRDLKPDNLFLHQREQGPPQLKILDFGVAKIVADAGGAGKGETLSVGTPMFMAPEQFTGSHPVSAAADRYAMAHVAYMLLVGECYFDPEAEEESAMLAFARRVIEGAKEAPSLRAARRRSVHLPKAFDTWFAHATDPDPARRHGSAAELVDGLESALGLSFGGAPTLIARVGAPPEQERFSPPVVVSTPATLEGSPRGRFGSSISGTTTPHRPQLDARRSRATMVLGAVGVVGGLAVGVGVWFLAGSGTEAPGSATSSVPKAEPASPAGGSPSSVPTSIADPGASSPAEPASSVLIEPTSPAPPSSASAFPTASTSAAAGRPPASGARPPRASPAPPKPPPPPAQPKYSRD